MAVYKLYPANNNIDSVVAAQKQSILAQLQSKQFQKDNQKLEIVLNEFFYGKQGDNYDKYYKRAKEIATQAFNEKYSSYPFELNMNKLSAISTNPNLKFADKSSMDLSAIKQIASEIEMYMQNVNVKNSQWSEIIAKVQQAQSLSEWNDVKDLNGIVASILFGNKTVYGDAFEYPLAAFSTLLANGAENTKEDLLTHFKDNLKGGQRSKSYLDIQHLSKKDRKNLQIKNSVVINNGLHLEYKNPTQDKIDVIFHLNNDQYNISAKSYSSIYKDIHILGGASLAAPVLNLSTVDFVSNYLTQLYEGNNLTKIHEAVRLNILFMSLTGAGSSQEMADMFVLNDKASKRIYVRNMHDIINSVALDNKWQYLNINNKGSEIPDQPLQNYKNNKDIKYNNVVSSMITSMHAIKLQVSIRGLAIKNAINKT